MSSRGTEKSSSKTCSKSGRSSCSVEKVNPDSSQLLIRRTLGMKSVGQSKTPVNDENQATRPSIHVHRIKRLSNISNSQNKFFKHGEDSDRLNKVSYLLLDY